MSQSTAPRTTDERPIRRPPRSKDGCLTCRRRKVRCNEQKPRCSHCERLNLECKWPSRTLNRISQTAVSNQAPPSNISNPPMISSMSAPIQPRSIALGTPFDDVFDYASFMWDGTDFSMGRSPSWPDQGSPAMANAGGHRNLAVTAPLSGMPFQARDTTIASSYTQGSPADESISQASREGNTLPASGRVTGPDVPAEEWLLTDYFVRTVVPPILAQVETQQKWSAMRQILMSMSNSSTMVRHAILAFADLLLCRNSATWTNSTQKHYDKAIAELSKYKDLRDLNKDDGTPRQHLLATLFFLSYIDLLEGKISSAHANLKSAYDIFQRSDKTKFRIVELRLLSWIRLLDARAVSAGGEGLFLSDDNETLLAEASPASTADGGCTSSHLEDSSEGEIEEVLFNVLYQPGFVFFQKVQSFMGRISKVDQWHRSRGTVEDETEVMAIAGEISKDLNTLYDNRPPLMDYAVAGRLTSAHVAANLAFTITRAFRTYLSNYHASKIHLHRVAYRNLPLAAQTVHAISAIRQLARSMVEGPESEEMLPVNMLWPLLMWGCEENDPDERRWIKTHILNMKNVATNATITAHVLEEVQARQDATKQRVDVRQVMHDIFDSCFAIV